MAGTPITYVVPVNFAPNEDVYLRRSLEPTVKSGRRKIKIAPVVGVAEHLGTAAATEPAPGSGLRSIALQGRRALHDVEQTAWYPHVGGESGAVSLPTIRAMTMDHLSCGSGDAVSDLAAGT